MGYLPIYSGISIAAAAALVITVILLKRRQKARAAAVRIMHKLPEKEK